MGFLVGAEDQLRVALQHTTFSQESLAQNNLAEAKRHAEHVVNILDGEDGESFGDLNLDGQAQNPGDGFGVRSYLQESRLHLEQALASVPPTANRQYHAELATAAIDTSLQTMDNALDRALTLLATDTVDEAQPFADDLQEHLNTILADDITAGTMVAAREHTLTLAAIPLVSQREQVPAPDALAETVPGRVGFLRFSTSTGGVRGGGFLLQMTRLAPPPSGLHYDAWLVGETMETDAALFLGQLDVLNGYASLAGSHPQNLPETYRQFVVSVEETIPNQLPAETIRFEGRLITDVGQEAMRLLNAEDGQDRKGSLYGAEEQTRTALQHKGFAQDELTSGNLDGAKQHTEHVINILDGADGEHFGDVNLDGQAQNPGDGVGVRGYLLRTVAEMGRLQEEASLTSNQRFAASLVTAMSNRRQETAEQVIQQGLKLIASDTQSEARPFLDTMDRLLNELLHGHDTDGNGVIDPLLGEGGILAAQERVLALNEVHIFPTER
jgi:hypothetical protein